MAEPGTAALLDIARTTLQQEVIPGLEGDARFKALMVANAIAIAMRALGSPPAETLPDATALCQAIRSGARDDDAALAARLRAWAEARCAISAPKTLINAPP